MSLRRYQGCFLRGKSMTEDTRTGSRNLWARRAIPAALPVAIMLAFNSNSALAQTG